MSAEPAKAGETPPPAEVDDAAGEEAETAAPPESEPKATANMPEPADEDGMVWPEGSAPLSAAPKLEPSPDEEAPLPKLDELTKRIPAGVRETLDDLFRARFVTVRRVSPKTLKS